MSGNDESDTNVSRNARNTTNEFDINNHSNNSNNNNNNTNNNCELYKKESVESVESICTNSNLKFSAEEREEKECSKESTLSYCSVLNKQRLAVPMVADTLQQSVTRNDAKVITETRLKRLKELSQRPEEQLSKNQKDEKKRIIRLEKNRRAAAMSRRKKKMYVKGLEDKCSLMARHLAILEMENSHLRALLNNSNINNQPTNISHFKLQQQNISNISHFQMPNIPNFINNNNNNNNNNNSNNTNNNDNNPNSICETTNNSIEPSESNNNSDHPRKRRKLIDCSLKTPSLSCDNSSDISILEPLPVNNNNNSNNMVTLQPPPPPSIPVGFMHHSHLLPPNITNIHPSRLMPYHPHHYIPHQYIINNNNNNNNKIIETICIENDEINNNNNNKNKENAIVESKSIEIDEMELDNENNNENDENNDMPPEIIVPQLSNDYLSLLDDDIIDETVDECGTVIPFQQEIQQDNVVYL